MDHKEASNTTANTKTASNERASHLCEGVHTCRVHVRHLGGGGLASVHPLGEALQQGVSCGPRPRG
jgi:hypothetical protein